MFPSAFGGRCSKCGKWYDSLKKVNGKLVCFNCARKKIKAHPFGW